MDTCICISHSPETIAALFVNWLYPRTKTKKFFFFFLRGVIEVGTLEKFF